MRIACIGYREWALNIYNQLRDEFPEHIFLMQLSKKDFSETKIEQFEPDIILFYGWSEIISSKLIDTKKCLMLHPSPLPKYRGGSPIQHQIINGESHSAVSIFLMNNDIDSGPIIKQEYFNLNGTLDEIFSRIQTIGTNLTRDILVNGFHLMEQNSKESTFFTRRLPEESEITLEEIESCSALYLYNKVRMLQDPYPNPFIKTADGKRLVIKSCEIVDDE